MAVDIRMVVTKQPPLIAVTGYGQERDFAATRAAGFVAHLAKPVDMAVLEILLERIQLGKKA